MFLTVTFNNTYYVMVKYDMKSFFFNFDIILWLMHTFNASILLFYSVKVLIELIKSFSWRRTLYGASLQVTNLIQRIKLYFCEMKKYFISCRCFWQLHLIMHVIRWLNMTWNHFFYFDFTLWLMQTFNVSILLFYSVKMLSDLDKSFS